MWHKTILFSYFNNSIDYWHFNLNAKSNSILSEINNSNEAYWKELRNTIEKWQLHFLSQHARINNTMMHFDKLRKYEIINEDEKVRLNNLLLKDENKLKYNLNQIKYSLDNLATPGHTHDEQLLQKETEKGNERILLLSFLAMSIPMIGAILSPALAINTKIITAIILLSLPFCYISFRKL